MKEKALGDDVREVRRARLCRTLQATENSLASILQESELLEAVEQKTNICLTF